MVDDSTFIETRFFGGKVQNVIPYKHFELIRLGFYAVHFRIFSNFSGTTREAACRPSTPPAGAQTHRSHR